MKREYMHHTSYGCSGCQVTLCTREGKDCSQRWHRLASPRSCQPMLPIVTSNRYWKKKEDDVDEEAGGSLKDERVARGPSGRSEVTSSRKAQSGAVRGSAGPNAVNMAGKIQTQLEYPVVRLVQHIHVHPIGCVDPPLIYSSRRGCSGRGLSRLARRYRIASADADP